MQPLTLPEGKVGVLQGQLGQGAGLPSGIGRVEARQFPEKHLHRPVIGDDMVHGEQQHMLLRSQPQDLRTYQGSLRQGKGALRLLAGQAPRLRLTLRLGQGAQIRERQGQAARRGNDLHGLSLLHGKAGSQGFVAAQDLVEALLQDSQLKGSPQPQGERQVV